MGRVARCLALANALQRRRYQMVFLSRIDNHQWPDRIRRFRHLVTKTPFAIGEEDDRSSILKEVMSANPTIVITDSPDIDEEYLALLSARVPLVISLDETAKIRFASDLVINPTLGHHDNDYELYPDTQLVAGCRYAMIRSEFRRARNVRATEPGKPTRVLVALSAGEAVRDTLAYVKALLANPVIEKIDAVCGSGVDGREELQAFAEENSDRVHITPDARDLGTRMTKAHLLICGGGNTSLEATCVGVPMLIVSRHEHHVLNATRLEEIGVAQYLGDCSKVSAEQVATTAAAILEDNFERKTMSRSGRRLIDGRGADRIVTAAEILLRRSRRLKRLAAA